MRVDREYTESKMAKQGRGTRSTDKYILPRCVSR